MAARTDSAATTVWMRTTRTWAARLSRTIISSRSAGGPIKKDKLFYFAAFDGMRYTVGTAATATLPTVNGGAVDPAANSVPLQIQDMINNHNILPSPLSLSLSDCTVTGASPNATATCGTKGVFRNDGLLTQN